MDRKIYSAPEVELIVFAAEDILMNSPGDNIGEDPGDWADYN